MKRSFSGGILRGLVAAAVCLALGAGVALGRAVEVARAKTATGKVTVRAPGAAGKVKPVDGSTQFKEGDLLIVESGGRATIEFEDQATISLVGPARMQFVELTEQGRRVKLESGVITQAFVRGIALGIQTPHDAEFVLQNATGFARVVPGDKVTFQVVESDENSFTKVFRGGQYSDLDKVWTLSVRTGAPGTGPAAAKQQPAEPAGDVGALNFGSAQVKYLPKSEFRRDDLPNGGVRLTYTADDFGRVEIGDASVLFLGPDEYILFDAGGQAIEFTGVAHVYHPIDFFSFYENPIDGIDEASSSRPRRR
jgi:hypothetical protein